EDRRIILTKGATTTVLARDVAVPVVARYSHAGRWLAYQSTNNGAVLLDIEHQHAIQLTSIPARRLAFAGDGSRILSYDKDSMLIVWTTESKPQPIWQRTISQAASMRFSGNERIVVRLPDSFLIISLIGGPDVKIAVSGQTYDVSTDYLAVGD